MENRWNWYRTTLAIAYKNTYLFMFNKTNINVQHRCVTRSETKNSISRNKKVMHSFYFEIFYLTLFCLFLKNIAPAPAFTVDGVSRFDFGQGILGRNF